MKQFIFWIILSLIYCTQLQAQTDTAHTHLYIDIHRLPVGSVKFSDVAAAHKKDLAVQSKYNVNFMKYWVDETKGIVYCLSSAKDSGAIRSTHAEAHGLLPAEILPVSDGVAGEEMTGKEFFMDIHNLGEGKVTAADVAAAHQKDLAVQGKYGVNFINYWVDEKTGVVVCLSQAKKAENVVQTHKEAHGLLPDSVIKVKQGQ